MRYPTRSETIKHAPQRKTCTATQRHFANAALSAAGSGQVRRSEGWLAKPDPEPNAG